MVTTVLSFTELMWGIKVVTHIRGLAHSKCLTDTGGYNFTIVTLEEFYQNSSHKTNLPYTFFPSILNVLYGPSGFSRRFLISTIPSESLNPTDQSSNFLLYFWFFPLPCCISLQVKISFLLHPSNVFFRSLENYSRIQICKDKNGLCGDVFLIFKMWITAMVMKFVQRVIYFKEPGILNQNLW